jgi:hypothetical protein
MNGHVESSSPSCFPNHSGSSVQSAPLADQPTCANNHGTNDRLHAHGKLDAKTALMNRQTNADTATRV